jgi:hypothetical protein
MANESGKLKDVPMGLEDVLRSVRELARSTQIVGSEASHILERELGMVIGISERIRDKTLSPEILHEARTAPLPAAIRRDVHRAVDLVADVASVVYVSASDFVAGLIDERRIVTPRAHI